MLIIRNILKKPLFGIILTALAVVSLSGCGNDGPAVLASSQSISFGAAPPLDLGNTATVTATASSGLAVRYSSTTPSVCTVDSSSGLVTDLEAGACIIAANQSGNSLYSSAPQVTQTLTVVYPPQTISFGAVPTLTLGGTAIVSATASSGLPVTYSSTTPTVCTVDGSSGQVIALTLGTCIIAADQTGDKHYAPAPQVTQSIPVIYTPGKTNQTISFGAVPNLPVGGTARVSATASSGLPVTYSSTTPGVCTVNSSTGLVTDVTTGNCIIAADQAGDATYNAAPQATQTITVSDSPVITVPGAPTGVSATAGTTSNTVSVGFGATSNGGSPITLYTVTSSPTGISASGPASPITVTCPSTCTGYAFSVFATNAVGSGAPSAMTDVITTYKVVETFYEPDTQPRDSIFIGSFTLNSTTGTVSKLSGILSESMTGGLTAYPKDTMTWLPLKYQLSSVPATLGGVKGLLVTTFMLNTTNTLSTQGGGDGWSPGTGFGLYYGFPAPTNPGNAYAMIFVNTANPTAALTQAQIDKLAYADCAPGGMMGAACMTGTTKAGYGTVGTMSGYPVSQTITKQ